MALDSTKPVLWNRATQAPIGSSLDRDALPEQHSSQSGNPNVAETLAAKNQRNSLVCVFSHSRSRAISCIGVLGIEAL